MGELEFLLLQNGDGGAGNSQQGDHNADHIAGLIVLFNGLGGQLQNSGILVLLAVQAVGLLTDHVPVGIVADDVVGIGISGVDVIQLNIDADGALAFIVVSQRNLDFNDIAIRKYQNDKSLPNWKTVDLPYDPATKTVTVTVPEKAYMYFITFEGHNQAAAQARKLSPYREYCDYAPDAIYSSTNIVLLLGDTIQHIYKK